MVYKKRSRVASWYD